MKRPGLTPLLLSATLFLIAAPAGVLSAQESMPPKPSDPAARRADDLLKRFDKNGDGKLDDDERADAKEVMMKDQTDRQMARAAAMPGGPEVYRARMLELFDANKDGRLDDDERAAAQKFAAERGFTPNGELRDELIKRFDKNGNGRIDEDERGALQAFVKERMNGPIGPNRDAEEKAELEKVIRAAIEGNAAQLKFFDEDQDGRLNDKEWTAARMRIARLLAPMVNLTPEQEQRRLQAVADEVARRRKLRDETGSAFLPKK